MKPHNSFVCCRKGLAIAPSIVVSWLLFSLWMPLLLAEEGPTLSVSGEPLAWQVENRYFRVSFAPNPETGRSGQLNTIAIKGTDVVLTRGVPNSTLHLSPNSARGADWRGANRWNPPAEWNVEFSPTRFFLERQSPLPQSPEIDGYCSYELDPASPFIWVTEKLHVRSESQVSLLRVDEWSTVPGPENPFSHIAWSTTQGHEVRTRTEVPILPLETRWVAFYSEKAGVVLASILESFEYAGPANPVFRNESLHFAGDPHYFYRAFVFPPLKASAEDQDPLVRIPAEAKYEVKYRLLASRAASWDAALAAIQAEAGVSQETSAMPSGDVVVLPKPRTMGGRPLMEVLMDRASIREFATRQLPLELISDLLWAAWGVNRPDGRRTAPSAMNRQETELYLIVEAGAYLYQAREHRLRVVSREDLRALAGTQEYVKSAPVNLVFVADTSVVAGADNETKAVFSGATAGAISQNVYLFCASQGMATVVRASVDQSALAKALGLRPEQRITLAQSVGFKR